MKTLHYAFIGAVAFLIGLTGCHKKQQQAQDLDISTFRLDSVYYLVEGDTASPTFTLHIAVDQMKPRYDGDSLAKQINNLVYKYTERTLEDFIKTEVESYRESYTELYLAQKAAKEEVSPMFSNDLTYKIKLTEAYPNVVSVKISSSGYGGGAHGYSQCTLANFHKDTGKEVGIHDIFKPEAEKTIISMIEKRLIQLWGAKDDKEMKEWLFVEDLYIPANFLLEKDSVRFLYNEYEIAPYAMGTSEIRIAYSDLKDYLQKQ